MSNLSHHACILQLASAGNYLMKNDISIAFGNKVRQERLKQRLSQEELAEKAELHRTYIGMIERAEKNITLVNMYKIAKALNIKLRDLLD